LWCSSYHFPLVHFKKDLDQFWRLLRARAPLEQAQSKQSWKSGPNDSIFNSKHNHTVCGAILIVSRNTAEKCFCQILTTFPSSGTTEAGKVENRTRMTWFDTRNIPTLFVVQFLLIPIGRGEKSFSQILTISRPGHHRSRDFENRTRWLGFASKTYPHILWFNSYRFLSVSMKKVLVEFWRLFRAQAWPEQAK